MTDGGLAAAWLGQLSLIAADGSLSHALVTNPGMGGG